MPTRTISRSILAVAACTFFVAGVSRSATSDELSDERLDQLVMLSDARQAFYDRAIADPAAQPPVQCPDSNEGE